MVKKLLVCLAVVVAAVLGPGVWGGGGTATEAVVSTAPAADEAPAAEPAPAPAEPQALPRSFEEILDDSAKVEVIGCTASYNCVHGTIISCSAPVNGTCSSSGAGCGAVTCDGVTTWCPGRCRTAVHCYSFCLGQGSSDGYCDEFGCCVCL